MEKKPLPRRYKVWSAFEGRDPPPSFSGASSDIKTLRALYSYGTSLDIELEGTCSFPPGRPVKCKTAKISAEEIDLVCQTNPWEQLNFEKEKGSVIRLDLDQIGPFGGVVDSQRGNNLQILVDREFRTLLDAKLARVAAQRKLGIPAAEAAPAKTVVARIELRHTACAFTDHIGTLRKGTVVNVSQHDILLRATVIPPMNALITFQGPGRHRAEVTNKFAIGFLAKFLAPFSENDLSPDMMFIDM